MRGEWFAAATCGAEKLYRERWSAFARVAISITGSFDLGTEAVQEGFARAIEQRQAFRGGCPLDAWVWRKSCRPAVLLSDGGELIRSALLFV
jgi:DNA-directed RNA polymerase specialized sigma24 family protein